MTRTPSRSLSLKRSKHADEWSRLCSTYSPRCASTWYRPSVANTNRIHTLSTAGTEATGQGLVGPTYRTTILHRPRTTAARNSAAMCLSTPLKPAMTWSVGKPNITRRTVPLPISWEVWLEDSQVRGTGDKAQSRLITTAALRGKRGHTLSGAQTISRRGITRTFEARTCVTVGMFVTFKQVC